MVGHPDERPPREITPAEFFVGERRDPDGAQWVETQDLMRMLNLPQWTVLQWGRNGTFRRKLMDHGDPRHRTGVIRWLWDYDQCLEAWQGYLPNRWGVRLNLRLLWHRVSRPFVQSEVAEAVGIPRTTFQRKMHEAGYRLAKRLVVIEGPCVACRQRFRVEELDRRFECASCESARKVAEVVKHRMVRIAVDTWPEGGPARAARSALGP